MTARSVTHAQWAAEGAERFGCVCLLKGADTLVAAPGEGVLVSTLGPPALATAGTGDVLTGVIAALIGQDLEPFEAAILGDYESLAPTLAEMMRVLQVE